MILEVGPVAGMSGTGAGLKREVKPARGRPHRRRMLAVAACASAALVAACSKNAPDPAPVADEPAAADVSEPAPAAPADPFARAAIFECVDGGELAVIFDQGDTLTVTVRSGGVPPVTLKLDLSASEPTYREGSVSFKLLGGDALYATGAGEPAACRAVGRDVPPPQVPGVRHDLREADNGSAITLGVGESLSISLSGVPTAGYLWAPATLPAFLEKTTETGGPTSTAQFVPGFAGGSHWEVIAFKAVAAGEGELVLAQRRQWEDAAEPDAATFKVQVVVR